MTFQLQLYVNRNMALADDVAKGRNNIFLNLKHLNVNAFSFARCVWKKKLSV